MFQQEMRRLFSVDLAVRASSSPLQARMTAYRGRRLRLAALSFSPHSTLYVPRPGVEEARLLVSVHQRGQAIVRQDGRESRVVAGDFFVIDPARPFTIETGEMASHSVYLSTSAVRALVPNLDQLTAVAIPGGEGVGAIFRAATDQLFASVESLREDVADRLGDALPYLLASALASLSAPSGGASGRLHQLHTARIRQFVLDNLGDSSLDASRIAKGVHLSERHVHELFESQAQSLMKWVWSTRLERCHSDLLSPSLRSRTLSEIAYSWGFSDVCHFSRAFKQKYGSSPRSYRADAFSRVPSC